MNKKILILIDKIGPKSRYLVSYIRKKLNRDEVFLVQFSDLFFEINDKNIEVTIESLGKKLSDFNLVYFRRPGDVYFSLAGTTAIVLNSLKIPFYDTAFLDIGPDEDKFLNLVRLFQAGLPVLHTFFCWRDKISKHVDYIISKLGFPVVAKESYSHHGKGIRVIRDRDGFKKLLDTIIESQKNQLLFQKFIDIEREYRFLVIGDKVRSVQRMYRDTSKFELKIDQDRKEEFLPVNAVSQEMRDIAVKAAKVLKIEVAGADLVIERGTGKIWLFEVNRGPGFTYDVNISPEIPALTDFFEERINSK